MIQRRTSLISCFAALSLLAMATAGCSVPKKASDLKPSKLFSLGDEDEPEEGIPVRMEGNWTDTVLNQAGKKPQRGFGGRLFFYGRDEQKPILVDGQLVVYAFDEMGREPTDNKPTRRYVFPADQMSLRMSKTEVGASYSFWLPWDEAGGTQTEVSLICRFEPKGGAVVVSEQTRHLLPGSLPPNGEVARRAAPKLPEGVPSRPAQPTLESVQRNNAANSGVQLASYESAVAQDPRVTSIELGSPAANSAERRMTTTSIPLPQNYRLPTGSPRAQPGTPVNAIQRSAIPQAPIQTPAPATTTSMQPQVFQSARAGTFPPQALIKPTVATPTVHLPTSQGFGFAAAANGQALAPQTAAPQVAPRTYPGMVSWSSPQQGASQLPQQQAGRVQFPQQATIVQPASQPLPPPTPLTTTVSSPPVPFLQ
jgi:hypothetical protein